MTTIYMIRHGQTESNLRSTYLGHTDIELNEKGQEQAAVLGEHLKNIHFDALYTSPLIRAVQTSEQIVKHNPELNLIMSYDIQERDYGIFDDLTMDEIIKQYPNEHKAWLENWIDYEIPEGESAEAVHKRAAVFLDKIIDNYPDGRVAVVTHLGVARHMIAYLLNLNIRDSWHFSLDNCGTAEIQINNGYGVLTGLNRFKRV